VDDAERNDLIARLFFVLTARLEDAAALAATGQDRTISAARQQSLANNLAGTAGDIEIIAEAAAALASAG
jgi:hypothetical protein